MYRQDDYLHTEPPTSQMMPSSDGEKMMATAPSCATITGNSDENLYCNRQHSDNKGLTGPPSQENLMADNLRVTSNGGIESVDSPSTVMYY